MPTPPHACPEAQQKLFDMLTCPLCQHRLALASHALRCPSRHTFNIARHGYVSLLTGSRRATSAVSGLQVLLRPKPSLFPYSTPHPAVFICSSATPPGPGVHGMSGHNAAKAVWRRLRQQ